MRISFYIENDEWLKMMNDDEWDILDNIDPKSDTVYCFF